MQSRGTYFEQVPLEKVKAIVRAQMQAFEGSEKFQPAGEEVFLDVRAEKEVPPMRSPFDIFRAEEGGTLMWRCAAGSMDEARARAREFAESVTADHVIVNIRTGMRVTVRPHGRE